MSDWLEDNLKMDREKIVISQETQQWINEIYTRCDDNQRRVSFFVRWRVALIAVIGIVSFIGVNIYNPTLTKAIPPIYTLLEKIHNNLFDNTAYAPYLEKTALSDTQAQITFSVEEVVYDYKEIGYRYRITSDSISLKEKDINSRLSLESWIMINEEKVDSLVSTETGYFIDDYTYQGDKIITLKEELPDEITLTLGINSINIGGNESIEGDWLVQTSIKQKTEPIQNLLRAPISHTWKIGENDYKVKINKVAYSSLYTYVELALEVDENQESQYDIDWTLIDSQGNTYIPQEIIPEEREHEVIYTAKFNPIPESDTPDWIRIVPSFTRTGGLRESTIGIDSEELKQVFRRKGFGDIRIDSIRQQGNDILMTATVGPIQDMRLQATRIILTNGENGIQCSQLDRINANQMLFWFKGARLQDLESIIFYDTNQQWDLTQSIMVPLL